MPDTNSKACTGCKENLPLEAFHNKKTSKDGKGSKCKRCIDKIRKVWLYKNKDLVRAEQRRNAQKPTRIASKKNYYIVNRDRIRDTALKLAFGLSLVQYNDMLDKQGGVCALCKIAPTKNKFLAVDHDHVTNKVRGLLCTKCNLGIGILNDDPDLLERCAAYIRANKPYP